MSRRIEGTLRAMARKLRVEYPGAIYHVLNRGDRRELIFRDDTDRQRFLDALGEACTKTGWEIHAVCLMPNHFHLVIETPRGNLVAGMKWFLGTTTIRFNRRHRVCGHLFSGRYKALVVDGSESGYLRAVCAYVHLNPVRARLLDPNQPLSTYSWSSYPEYLKPPRHRWPWLRVDRVFGEEGIVRDDASGRREFAQRMEQKRNEKEPEDWRWLRRGWFFGPTEVKAELLERMRHKLARHHGGEERRESASEAAERLVVDQLRRRGWTEEDLAKRRKTDPGKVAIARLLRRETVMTIEWIARRLRMGSRHTAANQLRPHPNLR